MVHDVAWKRGYLQPQPLPSRHAPMGVPGFIRHYREQPGTERRALSKSRQRVIGLDKAFLGDILRTDASPVITYATRSARSWYRRTRASNAAISPACAVVTWSDSF